jgi:hypothetical protein
MIDPTNYNLICNFLYYKHPQIQSHKKSFIKLTYMYIYPNFSLFEVLNFYDIAAKFLGLLQNNTKFIDTLKKKIVIKINVYSRLFVTQ